MADIFEALSAPARRAILDELRERDGQTLFELCSRLTMKHGLNLTRQAISQHLMMLEEVGLVASRRQGRYKFHHLNTERWWRAVGVSPLFSSVRFILLFPALALSLIYC